MKVIITDRFRQEYLKVLRKYFSLELFVSTLQKKVHKFISLNEPFGKFKIKLNSVDFRGVIFTIVDGKIIPLTVFLKKDKKFGMNISWQNHKILIETEHEKALRDIEKGKYSIY